MTDTALFVTGLAAGMTWTTWVWRRGFRAGQALGYREGRRDEKAGLLRLARARMTPQRPGSYYTCPACGPRVVVDEDGCCRGCGADATTVSPYPAEGGA